MHGGTEEAEWRLLPEGSGSGPQDAPTPVALHPQAPETLPGGSELAWREVSIVGRRPLGGFSNHPLVPPVRSVAVCGRRAICLHYH